MKTTIIAGFVIEPVTPAQDNQSFKITTIDRSKDANMHYRTIASEFAKKTGFSVTATKVVPDAGEIRFVFDCKIPDEPGFQFFPDEKDADIIAARIQHKYLFFMIILIFYKSIVFVGNMQAIRNGRCNGRDGILLSAIENTGLHPVTCSPDTCRSKQSGLRRLLTTSN